MPVTGGFVTWWGGCKLDRRAPSLPPGFPLHLAGCTGRPGAHVPRCTPTGISQLFGGACQSKARRRHRGDEALGNDFFVLKQLG